MFGHRYFGTRFFGPRYWGKSVPVLAANGQYFGRRYWGAKYFGPKYWGTVASAAVTPPATTPWRLKYFPFYTRKTIPAVTNYPKKYFQSN